MENHHTFTLPCSPAPISGAPNVGTAEVFMVWDVSFTCDVCGKTKGEANHWWMLSHADCACDEVDQVPQRFSVMPWSAEQSRNPEMRHLCGKGCAMQALERFMTQKIAIAEHEAEEDAIQA
jgi:hypothetical protein